MKSTQINLSEYVANFPESRLDINRLVADREMNGQKLKPQRSFHEVGVKRHEVLCFEVYISRRPDILLQWGYCTACMKVRYKTLIGFDETDRTAYYRDFIKNGQVEYDVN